MTLINVKTKQDLIKLKKNLIKRAEEEKLKDFNQDANLEKLYKPIVEPLKQIVSETKETKKSIKSQFSRETQLDPHSLLYPLMKQPEVFSLNSMCGIWTMLPSETPQRGFMTI